VSELIGTAYGIIIALRVFICFSIIIFIVTSEMKRFLLINVIVLIFVMTTINGEIDDNKALSVNFFNNENKENIGK